MGVEEKCISDHTLIYRILRQMHFMPNNDFEGKNIMLPKIAFQNLGTTKLHLGSQDPGSRKFSCPAGGKTHVLGVGESFGTVIRSLVST